MDRGLTGKWSDECSLTHKLQDFHTGAPVPIIGVFEDRKATGVDGMIFTLRNHPLA